MAWLHLLITVGFWGGWLALVWVVSQWVAIRWPESGPVLGMAGTLLLFLPSASLLAWDIAARLGREPRDASGAPLPPSHGYAAFSWRKVLANATGITLIGLGFGVSWCAGSS